MVNTYRIRSQALFLNDTADDNWQTDVLAASGDCLAALATQLDDLTGHVSEDDPLHTEMQRIVTTLLYLQQSYRLVKK